MRIAIFSEVYWPMVSGVSGTLQRLAAGLESRGDAVRVYTAAYDLPPGRPDLPTVHRSPARPLFLYPDVNWAFARIPDVTADLRRFSPDLVHVATEFAMGTAGVVAARRIGAPIVASAHTDYERYAARYGLQWLMPAGWGYLRWFYGQAARVFCPSVQYERHLHERGVRHTGIWSRGVDTELFHPRYRTAAFRAEFGIAGDAPLVVYVGRLAREKNLNLLLDAWRVVRRAHRRAELVLVGGGPLEEEIRAAALPGVHLAGIRTGRALAEAYAGADLFAFPSTTETFGNVLLEAMAAGVPALAAAAGGVLDFAMHGENAWLVAPDDEAALGAGLVRLLSDGALRRALAIGGRRTAESRRWDLIHDALRLEYAMVAGDRLVERAA